MFISPRNLSSLKILRKFIAIFLINLPRHLTRQILSRFPLQKPKRILIKIQIKLLKPLPFQELFKFIISLAKFRFNPYGFQANWRQMIFWICLLIKKYISRQLVFIFLVFGLYFVYLINVSAYFVSRL